MLIRADWVLHKLTLHYLLDSIYAIDVSIADSKIQRFERERERNTFKMINKSIQNSSFDLKFTEFKFQIFISLRRIR